MIHHHHWSAGITGAVVSFFHASLFWARLAIRLWPDVRCPRLYDWCVCVCVCVPVPSSECLRTARVPSSLLADSPPEESSGQTLAASFKVFLMVSAVRRRFLPESSCPCTYKDLMIHKSKCVFKSAVWFMNHNNISMTSHYEEVPEHCLISMTS